jgi:transcriptional regulator with XRE-family HTH domain
MHKKFSDLVAATMSPEAQLQARGMAQNELQKMELAQLREALQVSQSLIARKLKVTQVAISRLERRPNLKVGSLMNYLNALGGRLEMRAVLPDRTIEITHLLAPNRVAAKKARKNTRVPVARNKARRKVTR